MLALAMTVALVLCPKSHYCPAGQPCPQQVPVVGILPGEFAPIQVFPPQPLPNPRPEADPR